MAGLLSWLFRRGRGRAQAALPPPKPAGSAGELDPQVAVEPDPPVAVEPEPEPAPEPEGEISPRRLDDALKRLREEIPPASTAGET